MNCRECNGRGWVEVPDNCGKAASMCCGGCVSDETCFVCDGVGELSEALLNKEDLRAFETYYKLSNHRVKHETFLKTIYEHINDIMLNRALL